MQELTWFANCIGTRDCISNLKILCWAQLWCLRLAGGLLLFVF